MAGEAAPDVSTGTDQDADNQVDDQDDDSDDDDSGEGQGAYVPPTQEEHARMVATLANRKRERNEARREAAALKAAVKPATGAADGTAGEGSGAATPPRDPDARVKRLAGIAALTSEGLTREQARVAVKLLDLADVTVDDDGDADLDDEVAELKAAFPALFGVAGESRPGGGTPRVRTSGGRQSGGPAPTPDDKATAALLKAAGYR